MFLFVYQVEQEFQSLPAILFILD